MSIKEAKHKFLSLIILLLGFFIIVTSFKKIKSDIYIWIEAEDAKELVSPIELVEDLGASNGKAIVARGVSHALDGRAFYPFNIPLSANCNSWFRVYWTGGCSNTFLMKFDNGGNFTIGNDLLLKQWHWIKGPKCYLSRNEHALTITSEETPSFLDKILLTNNQYYTPQGFGELFNFECTFDQEELPTSIIAMNRKRWKLIDDNFLLENRMYYLKKLDSEMEYSLLKVKNINNFLFKLSFKSLLDLNDIHVRFLFGVVDNNNYHFLDFFNSEVFLGTLKNDIEIISTKKKLKRQLKPMVFNTIEIIRYFPNFDVRINDKDFISFGVDSTVFKGNIGFGSKVGDMLFDDVVYVVNLDPGFGENFFDYHTVIRYIEDPTKFGSIIGISPWAEISGLWSLRYQKDILGRCRKNETHAIIMNGEDYWRDYEFICAIKLLTMGTTGICFYCQDFDNYYRFDITQSHSGNNEVRLIKKHDGLENILINHPICFNSSKAWMKFHVKILNNEIRGYIDGKEWIRFQDNTYSYGKIGLFTTVKQASVAFDDIFVKHTENFEDDSSDIYVYDFEPRNRSSLDLCDWEIYNCEYDVDKTASLNITKTLFSNVKLRNKKVYKDVCIKIYFQTPPIPTLVTAITLNSENEKIGYRFEINDQYSKIWKNGDFIKMGVGKSNISSIMVTKNKGKLFFAIDEHDVIKVEDINYAIDTKYITIGFEGITEASINIGKITIEKM